MGFVFRNFASFCYFIFCVGCGTACTHRKPRLPITSSRNDFWRGFRCGCVFRSVSPTKQGDLRLGGCAEEVASHLSTMRVVSAMASDLRLHGAQDLHWWYESS